MLSKISIKDHPHHDQIVALAKELHAGEPRCLRQGKNASDYLLQVKSVFEVTSPSHLEAAVPEHPQAKQNAMGEAPKVPKVSFAQTVKAGKQRGLQVFPPKLGPTGIPAPQWPKDDWKMVQ